jgi:hypothetical protein
VDATVSLPGGVTIGTFVFSHASCDGGSVGPQGGGGPSGGETPEADSLILFGTGLLGLASYGRTRYLARRKRNA